MAGGEESDESLLRCCHHGGSDSRLCSRNGGGGGGIGNPIGGTRRMCRWPIGGGGGGIGNTIGTVASGFAVLASWAVRFPVLAWSSAGLPFDHVTIVSRALRINASVANVSIA